MAVVAGGIDIVYPAENQDLYENIVELGAVISEQPLGLKPLGRHFPRRNRIVSGLALGVVVVEAGLRSGSLISARLALEQGREVFAVPGSPLDPRSRGSNKLIRQGALLTESAADVIEALAAARRSDLAEPPRPVAGRLAASTPAPTEAQREAVLSLLGSSPLGVDELVRQCHLTAAEVMILVLELELAGRVRRDSSGSVSLK